MPRCFIALRVDKIASRSMVQLQDALRDVSDDAALRIRPVRITSLHLTVKFLGDVGHDDLRRLHHVLEATAREVQRPDQAPDLVGLGGFPKTDKPETVFAAVNKGRKPLMQLATYLSDACAEIGLPKEKSKYVPHVTLARIEQPVMRGPLSAFIKEHAGMEWGRVDTNKLILFQSVPQANGSVYTPMFETPWR